MGVLRCFKTGVLRRGVLRCFKIMGIIKRFKTSVLRCFKTGVLRRFKT